MEAGKGAKDKEHAMSQTLKSAIAVVGIDLGKNSVLVGLDGRGAIVLCQKWSRGKVEARFPNMPSCLIGMVACVGAHHLSRELNALGHDARLMPAGDGERKNSLLLKAFSLLCRETFPVRWHREFRGNYRFHNPFGRRIVL
jgi:hypothetical protein